VFLGLLASAYRQLPVRDAAINALGVGSIDRE
jgi:hypothetical protein